MKPNDVRALLAARMKDLAAMGAQPPKRVAEGGCGVVGYIATKPTAGRYIERSLAQMHNRGNGKGGGLAMIGCFPEHRMRRAILMGYIDDDQALDAEVRREHLEPVYEIVHREVQASLADPREAGLEIAPPRVVTYFCEVKPEAREAFATERGIADADAGERELVYRTSQQINERYYAVETPRAFVLSHARDMAIYKGVGYAEQVMRYYRLGDATAHGWIGHQRYPTRGRVWHPGGAHPFIGTDEALVHNGDFANYHAVTEYLAQHGTRPLFITDTEVAVLLFDLLTRVYGYSLEHTIEALAPTSQLDFLRLPKRKQRVYQALHAAHLHGSPDGPWFFIVARNAGAGETPELIGITDTSMLRPQVFALHDGAIQLGAVGSEKQAIDAVLDDLSRDEPGVNPVADRYWNARGGSHADGGAFVFRLEGPPDARRLVCVDKFGASIEVPGRVPPGRPRPALEVEAEIGRALVTFRAAAPDRSGAAEGDPEPPSAPARAAFEALATRLRYLPDCGPLAALARQLVADAATGDARRAEALELLTLLRDRHYDPGALRRAELQAIWDRAIGELLAAVPGLGAQTPSTWRHIGWDDRDGLRPPRAGEERLVIAARPFPPEGNHSAARLVVAAHLAGWRRFIMYDMTGDRFLGCGLGVGSHDVRIDAYGSPGDYLGSSLDGAQIHVHADAQDQIGQIMKSGLIVIHGGVGQTLLYGAKGGRVFVKGNAGGRALINAVGRIQAVINGTCLDYAAESFMAGRPTGDGFVVINGLETDERGNVIGLEHKYPGSTFFSLASGGAGYLNDPYKTVSVKQLNGAEFRPFDEHDWQYILPALRLNEQLFGISVEHDLQTVDGVFLWPSDIFRKVVATAAVADVAPATSPPV